MEMILQLMVDASSFLWGNIIAYLLLAVGIFYAIYLAVPQFRYFVHSWKKVLTDRGSGEDGKISGFGALMAAVGGQVGTGSLVGVASAIYAGGPGAIFWMWISALTGMAITFAEAVLGQLFKKEENDGTYSGGPTRYIEKGLKSRPLAIVMALLYVVGIGIFISSLQTSSIANAFTGVMDINPIIPGIVVTLIAAYVLIGGSSRLTDLSSKLVPFMAIGYIAISLFIIFRNIEALPGVITSIFEGAFSSKALLGGALGWTIKQAFTNGVARGLFSNDAGNGVAAIMHASADVKHPVDQAFFGMVGTFITTILICSMTAFTIIITGSVESGLNGINLLQEAFAIALGGGGKLVLLIATILFCFTTLIADLYYGENNMKYIFGDDSKAAVWIYRIVTFAILIYTSVVKLDLIWGAIDFFIALIIFINVIALLRLSKYVRYSLKDWESQRKEGIEEPVWNKDIDVLMSELEK